MKIHCDKCAAEISPFYLYCPYCGAEAPRKTLPPGLEEEELDHGVYCNHCGNLNVDEALYCSSCGESLYKRTEGNVLHCPKCSEDNKSDANFCISCKTDLNKWFSMEGEILEKLGYQGGFTLFETMNEKYYHFVTKDRYKIGRNQGNDIVIPCPWVSGTHSSIDLNRKELIDQNSSNGTYVNRSNKEIQRLDLNGIKEMNIAGVFTFQVIKVDGLFIFRLTAVMDQKEMAKVSHMDDINELRKHYYHR